MNFTELTEKRYSVRKFQSTPVPEEQIAQILKVALNAPTACNRQPQRIFVVRSEAGREKIRSVTPYHFNAPLFFVVCHDSNESWHRRYDGQDYGMVDGTIVLTQMMLKITELGLGSCFVASFDPEQLKKALELRPGWIPVGILPCGIPAADAAPAPQHTAKKTLSELVIDL